MAALYKINYKSDFVLTINSDAGWAVPFCIKFWTGMPSQAYFAGFDGENYVNCRVGETPTQLLVMFDDHHMPIGELKMQIAYHTTIEEFPDRKFDEVTNPTNVTVDIDGTEYQVMLDFTGETGAEIDFSMPSSGVMSVNGKIGYVTLNAEDVGAQPTIEDLATIRSGAAEGATAVQPAEMTAALATKQDVISDLAEIRSGAAAGATAYQKPGTGIPESDLASGVQSSLHKADAAAPQSNTYTKGEVDTLIEGASSDIDVDDALSPTSENPVQNKVLTTALNGKQDIIRDLSTIRNGAAAGATAVQPAALTPIQTALQTIEAVIPSAASSQNQLADKNFVNSSISTNTANFVGTYNSLAELQAVQNPTNNDYGFVIETDAQGNEYYDRYKYVASSQQWLFEYKVESTPFTAAQWAAIQSGITSALVTKLTALPTNAELQQTLDGKADAADIPTALSQLSQDSTHRTVTDAEKSTWNGKQNAISDLSTIRSGAEAGATAVQPDEMTAALAGKQNVIEDLSTIRSGAAAGATAVQPAAMNTALAAKQDTLTFDNAPTANSDNPVKSGGIKTALDAKQTTISTVNVAVDNNTGTPSGSASVSGSTLSLSFQNLKGATGATGATGPQGPQGERGLPGESGVTGDVSGFTVIQTIDPSATYGATDIAGAATVQATNQELTELAGTEQKNILTGFQIVVSKATTGYYGTRIGFVKGKKYHIRVTASAAYTNATSIILQTVSQQYEGQVAIGALPANALSVEFDYLCVDDNLQYFALWASGNHTITYGIIVSEYLKINEVVNKNRELLCPQATYVSFYMSPAFVIATALLTRAKYYMVQSGQKFRVKANNSKNAYILFLTSLPGTLSNNQDLSSYKVGSVISIESNTEEIIEVPATAGVMWVNISTYYQSNFGNYEPEYVSIIDEGNVGFDDVSNSNEWIVKNGVFFNNGKYTLHAGSAFKYISVQVGEKYAIVANTTHLCTYGLMKTIPATITEWSDIDAVSSGSIPKNQDIVVEIPSECNYLAVSVANAYWNYEPIYVGKSSAKSLNDNVLINTALINNVNTERILLIPVYGQSLAIGGDATPITTYCRFPKNCANTSSLTMQFGQSLETSVYGLVESYVDFKGQEDRIPAVRQTDMIASFSSGQGSTPISGLVKGTTLYSNLISSITTAYNARLGKKLIIPAFCWIQGEDDIGNGVDYYYNALSQLRADLDADIKAITGQTEDVHCIMYQTNQLCPTVGTYYNPTSYASGGTTSARMDGSVVAQWRLIKDSQYFHVSSPIYPMDFVVSSNNAIIHISGVSQKLLGYYEGLAAKRLMDGHGDDLGLYVTNVTKVDNTHIRLSLHVPAPPIIVDTESVYETANYGFSVINENSQNIISAISIERNNLDSTTILITTSADCTNAKVRYGVNGTNGYSGFDKGPRGNIRDSQGLWYKAVINNRKVPMHNWLLFFEYLIT